MIDDYPTHPKLHGPVRSGGREPGLINGREGGVGMSWSWIFQGKTME